MEKRDQVGLGVGGVFTLGVVTLMAVLFSRSPTVAHVAAWGEPVDIRVCDTAPAWVATEIDSAASILRDRGGLRELGPVTYGPCTPCRYGSRIAVCDDGGVTIDTRSQWFSEDHAGETMREFDAGRMLRASIEVPYDVRGDGIRVLPKDVRKLVLAHELVHALGYDHSFTRSSRFTVSSKTGELMNPSLYASGWGLAGLP